VSHCASVACNICHRHERHGTIGSVCGYPFIERPCPGLMWPADPQPTPAPMTEDPRINLVSQALWQPGQMPCPPIHNRVQADRAATLTVDALDAAEKRRETRPHGATRACDEGGA
jgi:hypothetical protein